jgi:hypothetical protein
VARFWAGQLVEEFFNSSAADRINELGDYFYERL